MILESDIITFDNTAMRNGCIEAKANNNNNERTGDEQGLQNRKKIER